MATSELRTAARPTGVIVRTARPEDSDAIAAMARGLSRQSINLRFMGGVSLETAVKELAREVRCGDAAAESLVAETPDGELVGEVYSYHTAPDEVEAAFVVADRWQHHRVGTALFRALVERLQREHVHALWCDTLVENAPMLHLLYHAGLPLTSECRDGVVHVRLALPQNSSGGNF